MPRTRARTGRARVPISARHTLLTAGPAVATTTALGWACCQGMHLGLACGGDPSRCVWDSCPGNTQAKRTWETPRVLAGLGTGPRFRCRFRQSPCCKPTSRGSDPHPHRCFLPEQPRHGDRERSLAATQRGEEETRTQDLGRRTCPGVPDGSAPPGARATRTKGTGRTLERPVVLRTAGCAQRGNPTGEIPLPHVHPRSLWASAQGWCALGSHISGLPTKPSRLSNRDAFPRGRHGALALLGEGRSRYLAVLPHTQEREEKPAARCSVQAPAVGGSRSPAGGRNSSSKLDLPAPGQSSLPGLQRALQAVPRHMRTVPVSLPAS